MENAITELELIVENPFRQLSFVIQLAKFNGIKSDAISTMLKYNVLTPRQLSVLTNRDISTIENLMRPRRKGNEFVTTLSPVFPFRTPDNLGPKFILYDGNCHNYIKSLIEGSNLITKSDERTY